MLPFDNNVICTQNISKTKLLVQSLSCKRTLNAHFLRNEKEASAKTGTEDRLVTLDRLQTHASQIQILTATHQDLDIRQLSIEISKVKLKGYN